MSLWFIAFSQHRNTDINLDLHVLRANVGSNNSDDDDENDHGCYNSNDNYKDKNNDEDNK